MTIPEKYKEYNPLLFAKGKRGLIYVFNKDKKKFALKIKNPKSTAICRIINEAKFLKLLNKNNIGPKLIDYSDDFVCYEFVEGIMLKDLIKSNKLNKKILKDIEKQCKILDSLNINKEEMHKPLKNILISNKKVVLIDFERCHFTSRPKNVNQFKQFLRRVKMERIII